MEKEILKTETDITGQIELTVRVPGFQNFGDRMNELAQAELMALVDSSSPEQFEKEKEAMIGMFSAMEDLSAKLDIPGIKEMNALAKQSIEESEYSKPEFTDEDLKEVGQAQTDPDVLEVVLAEEMPWDEEAERRLDQFLTSWPALRPALLEKTFQHYREGHEDFLECHGGGPAAEIVLPKPESPEVVSDLFCLTVIYLREDGAIGLGGDCTWDEEHAYGALIQDDQVVAVGHASEGFD